MEGTVEKLGGRIHPVPPEAATRNFPFLPQAPVTRLVLRTLLADWTEL